MNMRGTVPIMNKHQHSENGMISIQVSSQSQLRWILVRPEVCLDVDVAQELVHAKVSVALRATNDNAQCAK